MDSSSTHRIAVVVKYLAPTNTRSSRVSLTLPRWGFHKKVIPFEHEHGDTLAIALQWFKSQGIPVDSHLDLDTVFVLALDWSYREKLQTARGYQNTAETHAKPATP